MMNKHLSVCLHYWGKVGAATEPMITGTGIWGYTESNYQSSPYENKSTDSRNGRKRLQKAAKMIICMLTTLESQNS